MDAVSHLVDHVEPSRSDFVGRQQLRERLAHVTLEATLLARGKRGLIAGDQQFGDAVLLRDHAAPSRFRGVGGEGWLDIQVIQRGHQVLEGNAGGRKCLDGIRQGFWPGLPVCRPQGPFPIDAGDMELLGLVAKVESNREELENRIDLISR